MTKPIQIPFYIGEKKALWSKAAIVKEQNLVWISGVNGLDPEGKRGELKTWLPIAEIMLRCVEGIEAQTWLALESLKSVLEEVGSSLHNIVKMWAYYVGREFPEGIAQDQNWMVVERVKEEFFKRFCPEFSITLGGTPPCFDLIGVTGLGPKGALIEIAAVATLKDPPEEKQRLDVANGSDVSLKTSLQNFLHTLKNTKFDELIKRKEDQELRTMVEESEILLNSLKAYIHGQRK